MVDAPVTYDANFIRSDVIYSTQTVFQILWDELAWEQRVDAPRKEYWTNTFGRSYTYGHGAGKRTYQSQSGHWLISAIAELLLNKYQINYQGCFLNAYGTKRDWLGWHSDDDPGIDHTKPIAVVTVGQGRNIQFRRIIAPPDRSSSENIKGVYGPVETQFLEPGSLLLMGAGMQQTHQHRIPKAAFEAKPRISLTYRGLK